MIRAYLENGANALEDTRVIQIRSHQTALYLYSAINNRVKSLVNTDSDLFSEDFLNVDKSRTSKRQPASQIASRLDVSHMLIPAQIPTTNALRHMRKALLSIVTLPPLQASLATTTTFSSSF